MSTVSTTCAWCLQHVHFVRHLFTWVNLRTDSVHKPFTISTNCTQYLQTVCGVYRLHTCKWDIFTPFLMGAPHRCRDGLSLRIKRLTLVDVLRYWEGCRALNAKSVAFWKASTTPNPLPECGFAPGHIKFYALMPKSSALSPLFEGAICDLPCSIASLPELSAFRLQISGIF